MKLTDKTEKKRILLIILKGSKSKTSKISINIHSPTVEDLGRCSNNIKHQEIEEES